ncbi:MAG: PIN domain-containing protein [Candidatus Bathyarchaeia archaeon]
MVELERDAAVIPTIVIHEVYKLMHNHIGEDAARLRINSITASPFRIVDLTAKIAVASANLRCRYRGLPAADSIIAATSIETGSRRVLSDDPHFKQIHEIMCEWL